MIISPKCDVDEKEYKIKQRKERRVKNYCIFISPPHTILHQKKK
jgi:hypothetical protein